MAGHITGDPVAIDFCVVVFYSPLTPCGKSTNNINRKESELNNNYANLSLVVNVI
jgi:hypothetical protein